MTSRRTWYEVKDFDIPSHFCWFVGVKFVCFAVHSSIVHTIAAAVAEMLEAAEKKCVCVIVMIIIYISSQQEPLATTLSTVEVSLR